MNENFIDFVALTKQREGNEVVENRDLKSLSIDEIILEISKDGRLSNSEIKKEMKEIIERYTLEKNSSLQKTKNIFLQVSLNKINGNHNLIIDGIIGKQTKKAILNFQKTWNQKYPERKIAEDSIFGNQTKNALFEALNNLTAFTNEEAKNNSPKIKNKDNLIERTSLYESNFYIPGYSKHLYSIQEVEEPQEYQEQQNIQNVNTYQTKKPPVVPQKPEGPEIINGYEIKREGNSVTIEGNGMSSTISGSGTVCINGTCVTN